MLFKNRLVYMILGGLLALGLAFGGAAVFAQEDEGATTEEAPAETEAEPLERGRRGHKGGFASGLRGEEASTALAAELGISVEELEAAQVAAKEAAVSQAVADGDLTQEQADAILAGERGFRFGGGSEFLAEALGISDEELAAAKEAVQAAHLATLVEEGVLTQEQVDAMLARQAVKSYIDREALQDTMTEAFETAVSDALAAGDITQEQADALLEAGPQGFGGRGGHRGGGHGSRGGFGSGNGAGNGAPADGLTNQQDA